ncbi:hypothetical protein [Phytohabitans aurantiacus]|uniref:Uncharacterized protein n=1 Tax=Phytohabitans aurantiacus TaxID=3016789 RepID=A0ABQ5RB49_9ACTN|nr:hypothetical protein [Phytohabitans aurantiacus]GLI03959.1 hypothetical protein Pa4123_92400 [Phytohabitans aurantiacus]
MGETLVELKTGSQVDLVTATRPPLSARSGQAFGDLQRGGDYTGIRCVDRPLWPAVPGQVEAAAALSRRRGPLRARVPPSPNLNVKTGFTIVCCDQVALGGPAGTRGGDDWGDLQAASGVDEFAHQSSQ